MPDMLRRFFDRSDKAKLVSLEREAIERLLAWHTEKDPSKRSAAWHRLISAANDLALFRKVNGIE